MNYKKGGILEENARLMKKAKLMDREWYALRSILGYWWAIFYFLLGGREAGKSYATTEFFVQQWRKYGRPFYWMRLTEKSAQKLLTNNAEKLIDPDIRRKYKLEIVTKGDGVYEVIKNKDGKTVEKRLMARVLCLSTFYNDKGSGLFDADFLKDENMYYNICMDEMNPEKGERKTFDILYSFTNQLENLLRSTKTRVRVICIGNTLEEASDILCAFNFLPEEFGRYKLVKNKKLLVQYLKERDKATTEAERKAVDKKYKTVDFGKRAVIEYIEPSEAYKTRRKGTIADILMPTASTFTNKIDTDETLVNKARLTKPLYVVKFKKTVMFTVWNGNTIAEYNGEQCRVVPMRPYLDECFSTQIRDEIIQQFDTRCFKFKNLITFKKFQKELELLKPRK